MEYKSSEEVYMSWWLENAQEAGIVLEWAYEPEALILCKEQLYLVAKVKKTKAAEKYIDTKKLLEQQTYTYDFRIVWNPEYEGILFKRLDRIIVDESPFFFATETSIGITSYIDIKGGFGGSQLSDIRFPVKQALAYANCGIYVQKVVILMSVKSRLERRYKGLFVETFVPKRYLLTDKQTQKRQINFNYKLIEHYVKN